jgi:hypothetical protein
MLRQELFKQNAGKIPTKTIKLPRQKTIDHTAINDGKISTSDNLGEMSNFNNDPISCTPPDGYFIHNLKYRMGKS